MQAAPPQPCSLGPPAPATKQADGAAVLLATQSGFGCRPTRSLSKVAAQKSLTRVVLRAPVPGVGHVLVGAALRLGLVIHEVETRDLHPHLRSCTVQPPKGVQRTPAAVPLHLCHQLARASWAAAPSTPRLVAVPAFAARAQGLAAPARQPCGARSTLLPWPPCNPMGSHRLEEEVQLRVGVGVLGHLEQRQEDVGQQLRGRAGVGGREVRCGRSGGRLCMFRQQPA